MYNSILASNKNIIYELLEIATYTIKADFEVVNTNFERVAKVGQNISGISDISCDTIYAQVVNFEEECIVDSPRKSTICMGCLERNRCLKKLEMVFPIMINGRIIGVLGVFCYNILQREYVLKDLDATLVFIKKIIALIENSIGNYINNQDNANKINAFKNAITKYGIYYLYTDSNGVVLDCNDITANLLHIKLGKSIVHKKQVDSKNNFFTVLCEDVDIKAKGNALKVDNSINDSPDEIFFFDEVGDENFESELDLCLENSSEPVICGNCEEIIKLRTKISKMAKTNSIILIIGDAGCGKELAARRIHYESNRSNAPFFNIDCSKITPEKLFIELFGMNYQNDNFENSAFIGKIVLADGGILYIENMEYMPVYMIHKIFDIILDRQIKTNIGVYKDINVRFIFSSCTSYFIHKLSLINNDRRDTINIIPLLIPSLIDLKDDLGEFIYFFINRYKSFLPVDSINVDDGIIDMLKNGYLPNSMRELEFICMHIVDGLMAGKAVDTEYVNSLIETLPVISQTAVHEEVPGKSLRELEDEQIKNALAKYGDSTIGKKQAAKSLGIGIATLYRRLGEIANK